jgi:hypothetical protein
MGHLAARHPGIVMLSDIRAGMFVITLSDNQEVDVVERQGSRSSSMTAVGARIAQRRC